MLGRLQECPFCYFSSPGNTKIIDFPSILVHFGHFCPISVALELAGGHFCALMREYGEVLRPVIDSTCSLYRSAMSKKYLETSYPIYHREHRGRTVKYFLKGDSHAKKKQWVSEIWNPLQNSSFVKTDSVLQAWKVWNSNSKYLGFHNRFSFGARRTPISLFAKVNFTMRKQALKTRYFLFKCKHPRIKTLNVT